MKFNKHIALALTFGSLLTPAAFADETTAAIDVGGYVPTVFSVVARTYNADLDLSPETAVANHTVGILHFKHNVKPAAIVIEGDVDVPTNGATPIGLAGDFLFSPGPGAGCVADIEPALSKKALPAFDWVKGGVGASTAAAITDADCELQVTYTVDPGLQAPGLYTMHVTVTMTSS